MRFATLARLGTFLFSAARLGAQTVTNGGFESPTVQVGGFTLFSKGTTFNGWTVVGANGNVGIASGTFSQFGINFPAQSGTQWLDLTGLSSNQATGVQQTVTTVPGTTYDLSFWVGNVVNTGGIFGTTSTVNVLVNGSALAAATNLGGAGNSLFWQQFVRSFTATGTSTTLTFLNGDAASDNSNGLDEIALSVAGNPTTTPEPASATLVASGLIGVALVRWRRRHARS